jgi:1-acyl-sn-glycerol-3-phosphate acyltransferase
MLSHAPHPETSAKVRVTLAMPPQAPRAKTRAWERRVAAWVLRVGGWRMRGAFPDLPKAVLIAAPHSSNWDGIWIYFAATAMGLDVRILGKAVLFRIPVLNVILRRYGGIPAVAAVGRTMFDQSVQLLRQDDRCWIGIAPEGTRKQVARWRIGFWKIAHAADVPIVPVYLHYPDKVIGVMPAFDTTDDMQADIAQLRERYRPWQGKHHGL